MKISRYVYIIMMTILRNNRQVNIFPTVKMYERFGILSNEGGGSQISRKATETP